MEKIIIALFGLAWGSFLNVVIFRLPLGLSLVRPGSSCPKCRKKIRPSDNIPVLSFILLGGKCRSCGARIPLSYPLVEALTPLSFLLLNAYFGLSLHFFASCLFTSGLIVLAVIDFYHQILPDEIMLPGLLLGLVYAVFRPDMTLQRALLGAVAGAGFLLFVYGVYYLLRKKEGLGMGDVTLMLMIGAYVGWVQAFFTIVLASLAGAIVGAFFLTVKKKDLQFALPFGTFLAPSAFIALLWGEQILQAYLSLFKD